MYPADRGVEYPVGRMGRPAVEVGASAAVGPEDVPYSLASVEVAMTMRQWEA